MVSSFKSESEPEKKPAAEVKEEGHESRPLDDLTKEEQEEYTKTEEAAVEDAKKAAEEAVKEEK